MVGILEDLRLREAFGRVEVNDHLGRLTTCLNDRSTRNQSCYRDDTLFQPADAGFDAAVHVSRLEPSQPSPVTRQFSPPLSLATFVPPNRYLHRPSIVRIENCFSVALSDRRGLGSLVAVALRCA